MKSNKLDDWRLQALTTLAKPFKSPWTGTEYPVGTKVASVSIVKYDSKRNIVFPMPNATAMFLNMAHRFYRDAKDIITDNDKIESRNGNLHFISDIDAINYLESICASIVFAFNALETFANEVIPEDYIFKMERQDKKCTEEYSKERIERYLNIDIKFSKVLPDVFNVKTPKNKKVWQKYTELKRLRDRIIHLKSDDRKSSSPKDETIWKYLVKKDVPNMVLIAKQLIDYFVQFMEKRPRWTKEYPF